MNSLPYNFHLDKTGYIPEVPMNAQDIRDTAENILLKMAQVSGRDIEELRATTTVSTCDGSFKFSEM